MAPQYTFRSVKQNITNGGPIVQLLPANANRVGLIIASSTPPPNVGLITLGTTAAFTIAFASVPTNNTVSFPYRDYGPIIKEAVFIVTNTVNVDVFGTEITRIPNT